MFSNLGILGLEVSCIDIFIDFRTSKYDKENLCDNNQFTNETYHIVLSAGTEQYSMTTINNTQKL